MVEICIVCEGSGLRIVQEDGRQVARACECRIERRAARMRERAHIPKRYEHCSLGNFWTSFDGADPSLAVALLKAKGFVQAYPLGTDGRGLLLTGSIGVGKTHLAVGILRSLVEERGASGIFCDYRELLKEVQNSYNPQVAATELGVLRPVFEAEVLVLDELGASKPTDWVWDTVAHILNFRYNNQRTTIITTNYPNAEALRATPGRKTGNSPQQENVERAMREETLGDRIGERMRSRLQEMCEAVVMRGEDHRQKMSRSDFASLAKEPSTTPALQSATEAVRAALDTLQSVVALETLQSAVEKERPTFSKAIQDGAGEGLKRRRTRIDENVTTPSEPAEQRQKEPLVDSSGTTTPGAEMQVSEDEVVGYARMGRHAKRPPKPFDL